MNTLRSLLAYAVQNKLLIHQMDVNTAFLNGHLEDEVYMEHPPGYVSEGQEDLVCYLQRSCLNTVALRTMWLTFLLNLYHALVSRNCVENLDCISLCD